MLFRSSPRTVCMHTVSVSISLLFSRFFSPFPHGTMRYRCLCVFSLTTWASFIRTGFHVSRVTQDKPRKIFLFGIRGCYPLWHNFPEIFFYKKNFVTFRPHGLSVVLKNSLATVHLNKTSLSLKRMGFPYPRSSV